MNESNPKASKSSFKSRENRYITWGLREGENHFKGLSRKCTVPCHSNILGVEACNRLDQGKNMEKVMQQLY